MSNAGGQIVNMTPIADVTAFIGPSHFPVLTTDGNWMMDANASTNWPNAMRLYDQKIATFGTKKPLIHYYRNSIANMTYDKGSDRFCSFMGFGSFGSLWSLWDGNGNFLRDTAFSDVNISSEKPACVVANGGKFFGIIDADAANLGPQCLGDDGSDNTNWLWQQSGGFNNGTIVGENYLQLCYAGLSNQLVYWLCANDFYFDDVGFVPNPIPDFFGDWPKIGKPLSTNIKVADNSGQPWGDAGTFRNYNFQQTADGKIMICAVGAAGTNLSPIGSSGTSGTDYSGMSFFPPFDIALDGSRYTPVFPTVFTFMGSNYNLGGANSSILRAMSLIGGMLFAVVSVASGSTVIFVSGFSVPFAQMGLFQYDTLNWKRSLVYGVGAGDGT